MAQRSLGLIEVRGLAAAIEAADAAVKSANVDLIGYELSKGGGMVTVKMEGDVGAVKAAVSAATIASGKVGTVVSTRVIARPAKGIDNMVCNDDTVGCDEEDAAEGGAAPSGKGSRGARKRGKQAPAKKADDEPKTEPIEPDSNASPEPEPVAETDSSGSDTSWHMPPSEENEDDT